MGSSRIYRTVILSLAPLAVLTGEALLYRGGTRWWSEDDPQLLKHAISHHLWEFFGSPSAWRELSVSNLTPWLSFSFRLDWDWFGLSPGFFHLHQFLSLTLGLYLFYRICRIWLAPVGSLTAVMAFMLAKPVLAAGETLMLRHYVEGLVFTLGATLCFVKALDDPKTGWSLGAFLLYVLACTAKEIYVPLPIFLLTLPLRNWRDRLARLWPLFSFIPIYALWRWWMLGRAVGGYGLSPNLEQILGLPATVAAMVGWEWGPAKLLFLGLGTALFLTTTKEGRLSILVLAATVLLPLVPVSPRLFPRYAFVAGLIPASLLGIWVDRLTGPRWHAGRSLVAVLLALVALGYLWWNDVSRWRSDLRRVLEQSTVEGQYVLAQGSADEFIKNPAGPSWFYENLGWLRSRVLGMPPGPQTFVDAVLLLEKENYHVLVYDPGAGRLVKVENYAAEMERFRAAIRPEAPLSLTMRYQEPMVRWELGPWQDGSYALITEDSHQGFYPAPRQGRAPVQLAQDLRLRVKYSSPEGWMTYSPSFCLNLRDGFGLLQWTR